VRLFEQNNSADTKVSGGGGGRFLKFRSRWRSMVEQISTCSLWKGPHVRAGGCLKKAVTPWGALRWSRLLPGCADPWREEPTPE